MTQRFPDNFGMELAGLSFDDMFVKHPKWVEYICSTWTENCTGLFKDLLEYVQCQMEDPVLKAEHEERCRQWVKSVRETQPMPPYMIKYSST